MVNKGDQESARFAGTRLGHAHQVAPLQEGFQAAVLDFGGLGIAFFGYVGQQGRMQGHIGKAALRFVGFHLAFYGLLAQEVYIHRALLAAVGFARLGAGLGAFAAVGRLRAPAGILRMGHVIKIRAAGHSPFFGLRPNVGKAG
jgi:hypothetical protein